MQIKNNIKTIIKPREQTSAFFLPKHSVCLVYWDPVTLHIREVWSGLIVGYFFLNFYLRVHFCGEIHLQTLQKGAIFSTFLATGSVVAAVIGSFVASQWTKRIPKPTQVKPNYGGISCIPWHLFLFFFVYFEGKWMLRTDKPLSYLKLTRKHIYKARETSLQI